MALVNFCKKCKQEVPAGEVCLFCQGKLTKTNERITFSMLRVPAQDWFAWNQVLRVALPALTFTALAITLLEGYLSGGEAVQTLLLRGFFWELIGILGRMLLLMWGILLLQGKEQVQFVLDKEGVHAYTHLQRPTAWRLYARFVSQKAVEALQEHKPMEPTGGTLIRRVDIRWIDIKKVRCWTENRQLLFFNPRWWQVLVIACPPAAYEDAEAFVRKKLGKNRNAKIVPKKPASSQQKRP